MFVALRPDYFPVIYSPDSWGAVLEQLDSSSEGILCIDDQSFTIIGKISALWQRIKEYLGFTDLTHMTRVGARLIQFFLQGTSRGCIDSHRACFESVKNRILSGHLKVHYAVKKVLENIGNATAIQDRLETFYRENQSILKPTFWNRLFAEELDLEKDALFGSVHHKLADARLREDPEMAYKHLRQAAQIYNSNDINRLHESFQVFQSVQSPPKHERDAIHFLLAERFYRARNFENAHQVFNSAISLQIPFDPYYQTLFLITAASISRFDSIEQLPESCFPLLIDQTLKQSYTSAMTLVGDHYAQRVGTFQTKVYRVATLGSTPSSMDHCRKAFHFYSKAYLATLNSDQQIFQKILNLAERCPEKDLLDIHSTCSQWDAIPRLLLVMKGKDLLSSPSRRGYIADVTREIAAYSAKEGSSPEKSLYWIEEALKCIGPLNNHVSAKQGWMRSTPKGLFTKEGTFAFDVGAGLHFLKAEILQKQRGNTTDVLDAYKLATNLAPKNPFGAEALLLQDQQPTAASDIATYRHLAISWGAKP